MKLCCFWNFASNINSGIDEIKRQLAGGIDFCACI
jgi:hypothetical protein